MTPTAQRHLFEGEGGIMEANELKSIKTIAIQEGVRAGIWGLMLIIVLVAARAMIFQPYATKFNRMMGSAVLAATGVEVRNFTSINPEQAKALRGRVKQTVKEGIEYGTGQWQRSLRRIAADPVLKQDIREAVEYGSGQFQQSLRQAAADPVLKQDFKEAVEYTASVWHREARRQQ
jgi:hypothetical protein